MHTARALAAADSDFDRIVLVARESDDFTQSVAELRAQSPGCDILALSADLSQTESVAELFQRLQDLGVTLDTIINNAGFTKPASINETRLVDFELTMRVNLFSPFLIVQTALRQNHPLTRIINIASTAGMTGRSGWLTYSASKAAMINMSEVLREELKPYGIDVICLSPGRCATDLRRKLAPDEDPSTIMQPWQVADVIKLMTSPTGRLLMAQNLIVRT